MYLTYNREIDRIILNLNILAFINRNCFPYTFHNCHLNDQLENECRKKYFYYTYTRIYLKKNKINERKRGKEEGFFL